MSMSRYAKEILVSAISESIENSTKIDGKLDNVERGIGRVEKAILCQEGRQDTLGAEPADQVRHLDQCDVDSQWYESSKVDRKILESQQPRKACDAGLCRSCHWHLQQREMELKMMAAADKQAETVRMKKEGNDFETRREAGPKEFAAQLISIQGSSP